MSRIALLVSVLILPVVANAQYRCTVDGRSVVQSEPCADAKRKLGKYRCHVDGAVIYSDASCTTIKSKEVLAREAKEVDAANVAKKQAEASASATDDKRFDTCRAKLIQAQKLDLLYDMDWKPPKEPRVVVGPTFFSIPIDAKEGFVETVNCFLMAGEDRYINFDVLDYRTGKSLGRYSYGKFKMK